MFKFWLRGKDENLRPLGYEPDAHILSSKVVMEKWKLGGNLGYVREFLGRFIAIKLSPQRVQKNI